MRLAAIIPVYNGGDQLRQCLKALAGSSRLPDQVIVVDDSSSDGAARRLAEQHQFTYLRLEGGPFGPACARNRGARAVDAAIEALLFFDADVVIQPQTVAQIERYFTQQPQLDALFGSYDDSPPAPGIASRYKNLLHHYVHQTGRRQASTFWAGCGAVRRRVFDTVNGFDTGFAKPSVEDIELGMRLRRAGYTIWLCPDIQVTHLKHWTLGNMLYTDIFRRALPWSRLLLTEKKLPNDLNIGIKQRISAVAALVMSGGLVISPWLPTALALALVTSAAAVFLALEYPLLRFFQRRGGLPFAVAAAGLHVIYYLYSSAAFVWVSLYTTIIRI